MEEKPARYISPLTDFGFKKIFGDEEVMKEFLNDLIVPESPIEEIVFVDKEAQPETNYERGVIYDMRCKLRSGEEILTEMQNRGQDYFTDRINYYMARAIATQGDRGRSEWRFNIHPVYGIFFLNFYRRTNRPRKISHYALQETELHEDFSDKVQFWLIELPDYRKMRMEDCQTPKDYWLYILTHMDKFYDEIPFKSEKPIFQRVETIAEMSVLNPEDRERYQKSLDDYRTQMAVMEHERNEGRSTGYAEGQAEGMAEGMAKGMAEGMAQGLAEGRLKEKITIAHNLKELNMPLETIIQATGLTPEEIGRC